MVSSLYTDPLVSISADGLRLFSYYFPTGSSKLIRFADIAQVMMLPCTLSTGAWRLWGTGDFMTWFPKDFSRPQRPFVFHMTLRSQRVRIAWTAHDAERAAEALRNYGVTVERRQEGA